jgi:hypothetical protein
MTKQAFLENLARMVEFEKEDRKGPIDPAGEWVAGWNAACDNAAALVRFMAQKDRQP